jgi:hypothetical protein
MLKAKGGGEGKGKETRKGYTLKAPALQPWAKCKREGWQKDDYSVLLSPLVFIVSPYSSGIKNSFLQIGQR